MVWAKSHPTLLSLWRDGITRRVWPFLPECRVRGPAYEPLLTEIYPMSIRPYNKVTILFGWFLSIFTNKFSPLTAWFCLISLRIAEEILQVGSFKYTRFLNYEEFYKAWTVFYGNSTLIYCKIKDCKLSTYWLPILSLNSNNSDFCFRRVCGK